MEPNTNTPQKASYSAHPNVHESPRGLYITIFLILGFLTLMELFIPSVYSSEYSQHTKMLLLCFMAITKAGLVAMFFMHLKSEAKWVRWIAYTPIYMAFAVIIIMLESVYR